MGVFEIQDQVLGVKAASDIVDYIDLNRVAITGWSYGGYLSLMAIAQNPEFFKVQFQNGKLYLNFLCRFVYLEHQ